MELLVNGIVLVLILFIIYYNAKKFIVDAKNNKCSCGGSCSKEQRRMCKKI